MLLQNQWAPFKCKGERLWCSYKKACQRGGGGGGALKPSIWWCHFWTSPIVKVQPLYMCLTLYLYLYLCSMFMCLFKLVIKCDSIRLLLWLPAARPINIEDPITICGIRGGPCLDQRAPSNQTQIKVSTAIGKMLKKPADLLNLIPHNICNVAKRESPTNWWDKPTVHDCCGRLLFWQKYQNRSTETKSISCRGSRRGQAQ